LTLGSRISRFVWLSVVATALGAGAALAQGAGSQPAPVAGSGAGVGMDMDTNVDRPPLAGAKDGGKAKAPSSQAARPVAPDYSASSGLDRSRAAAGGGASDGTH
jgi:hypothetical protein